MPSRPILPHAVAIAVARMNIPHKLTPESHATHAANGCHTYGYLLPIRTDTTRSLPSTWCTLCRKYSCRCSTFHLLLLEPWHSGSTRQPGHSLPELTLG
ncbi:uncharacterized protein CLUP02_14828 [Colletotrichum lupini]|uniref:Uncharacterized protein n=1 Tax=Colletotrichum lupini TaxID=145971 RepID=A0A9Q8T4X1_9PEZI|nr:uncharacterized protein CLUP02_14828 [Colletotrichum lupini]UQC89299.1 hypothetical protein CLUP02_14828 [Colletotrichum lupini]